MRPDMLDLLPLCLGGPAMIVPGLVEGAGRMGRTHVVQAVVSTKLQSAEMLDNPALSSAIDLAATQHTHAIRFLPRLKPTVWSEFPAGRCAHIFDFNEWHSASQSRLERGEGAALSLPD